jgi:uncharacterized protein YkwD
VLTAPLVRRPARRRLGLLLTGALLATLMVGTSAAPASAVTPTRESLAASMISRINTQRTNRGLVAYRSDPRLTSLAMDRAARMASLGVLSHQAAGGSVGTALTANGVQWFSYGETIGMSGYAWGSDAVSNILKMWMGSSYHRPLILSSRYNYVGAGFAYRASDGTTWASVVFTESRDHTAPRAWMKDAGRSGTTIWFTWGGRDRRLQTHTAGLRSFDVQYRIDGGPWRLIRNDTTATSIKMGSRPHGHRYWIRVQSADRRGNLSAWTTAKSVWVP